MSSHSLRRRLRIGNRTAFDIPICWSMRWVFETLDGVDKLSDNLDALLAIVTIWTSRCPQLIAQLPPMITVSQDMQSTKTM